MVVHLPLSSPSRISAVAVLVFQPIVEGKILSRVIFRDHIGRCFCFRIVQDLFVYSFYLLSFFVISYLVIVIV
jgi:hypothetical protein